MPADNNGPFGIGSDVWAGLSKLIEEAGEVQQVCGKIIGTGGEVMHWDGSNLRDRLREELADLMAACEFVAAVNDLHDSVFLRRVEEKLAVFRGWHAGAKK